MRARLFARTGELAGSTYEIADEATIGRLADNRIVLPGSLVSGQHARIAFDPQAGCYRIEDLNSRNGTFVAGSRIREPEALGRLDVINFAGAFDFFFQVLEEEEGTEKKEDVSPAAGTRLDLEDVALPPGLAKEGLGGTLAEPLGDWVLPVSAPSFALRVEAEDGTRTFDLTPGEHLVGRAEDCSVAIDDRSLSRKHARLTVREDRVTVADLGSTNQTRLAGQPLPPEVETPVEPGAELVFGAVKATLIRR